MKWASTSRPAICLAAILLSAATGAEAQAQAQFKHDSNGRIIAMTNLSPSADCFPEIATGTVTERAFENGVVRGITFRDNAHGDIGINVPALYNFASPATQAKVVEGYQALLGSDHMLRIGFKVCGAAGRIRKLDAISLVGARAAPAKPATSADVEGVLTRTRGSSDPDQALLRSPGARQPGPAVQDAPRASDVASAAAPSPLPARTAWRASAPTKVQFDMAIASTDRAASWSITCTRSIKGQVHFGNWLVGSRNWSPNAQSPRIAIDGVSLNWEMDGADEGVVLSDSMQDNATALSPNALALIARGDRLVIAGSGPRNRPRDVVFDISGGEAAFASFKARCQTLPRS